MTPARSNRGVSASPDTVCDGPRVMPVVIDRPFPRRAVRPPVSTTLHCNSGRRFTIRGCVSCANPRCQAVIVCAGTTTTDPRCNGGRLPRRGDEGMKRLKRVTALMLCLGGLVAASEAEANARDQAQRMHNRLTGTPATDALLTTMASLIDAGQTREAALLATEQDGFYNVVLKNFATPWTN